MATQIIYFLNTAATAPDWFGKVQDNGSAPAGALSAFGWTVAKVSLATPYWRGRLGATARSTAAQATTWIGAQTGPVKGTGSGATTAGDSFRSDNPLSGTFAAGNWPFTFGMRSGAASHAGRIRLRVWASANADGTSARELTSAQLVGTTVTFASTTTTYNSTVTWAAPQVVLNNEYLFTQIEWNSTTVGTSNSCTAQFYQASFTTPDYVYAPATGTLAVVDGPDDFTSDGLVGLIGALADIDDPDTADMTGTVMDQITGTVAATEAADDASMTGDNGEVLPGTWVEVWTSELGGLNPDWAGYTIVGVIPVSEFSQTGGSKIRITFIPPWTYGGSEYSAVWIGNGGGADPYDFGDTPVRVTVGGSTTVTIIASGEAPREGGVATPRTGEVVTDEISFVKDATNSFVIAAQLENAALDAATYNPPAAGRGWYWKGVVEAGLANKSGYTDQSATGSSPAIWKIELFIGAEAEVTGTLDGDEPADTADLTGAVAWPEITGTLDVDDAADALASTGQVAWRGPLATTEPADTVNITATVTWLAPLATVEPADSFAATGLVLSVITGPLGVTEPADSFAATGDVISGLSGPLAAVELADSFAATGQVAGVAGGLGALENRDVAAATGQVAWQAPLAAVELGDSASLTGAVRWLATLAAPESADAANITATVRWLAPLAAVEPADSASMTGGVFSVLTGTFAVTEPADSFAASGTALSGLGGTVSAIETADIAAMTGQVTGAAGTLSVTEMRDTLFGTGKVAWLAALTVTEAPDTASVTVTARTLGTMAAADAPDTAGMVGLAGAFGTLHTEDAPDVAAITGQVISNAALAATEAPDTALFTSAPPSIQEAKGHFLRSSFPRVRVLESGEHRIRSLKYPVLRPRHLISNEQRVRDLDGGRTRTFEVA